MISEFLYINKNSNETEIMVMSTKYYIKDNEVYKEIRGREWYELLQKQKNNSADKRHYFIHFEALSNNEDDYYLEVSKEQYKKWCKERRRHRYIQEQRELLGLIDVLYSNFDDFESGVLGEELLADKAINSEERAIDEIMIKQLLSSLNQLTLDERRIIESLYLSEKPLLQKELAKELHISQQAVSKRTKAILDKLKKYL